MIQPGRKDISMHGDSCYEGDRASSNIDAFTQYMKDELGGEDEDESFTLPTKWSICDCCCGNGTHALHGLEVDPSEWDEDEIADYMGGRYDTPCGHCNGTGKVRELDEDRMGTDVLKQWQEWEQERYESDAMERAERRMGA